MKDKDWSGNLDEEANWKESGLIAQNVYQIPEFREYVKVGTETISWDINYTCLFTYNIRATQELKIENDELKKKFGWSFPKFTALMRGGGYAGGEVHITSH